MWVDPGCVAVRDGPGPGRSSMSSLCYPQSSNSRPFINDQVRVLFGSQPSPTRPTIGAPALTVDFIPATSKPAVIISSPLGRKSLNVNGVPHVNVCPSSPAAQDMDVTPGATPIVPWSGSSDGHAHGHLHLDLGASHGAHSRRSSLSSSASSRRGSIAYSTLSMDREQSTSSIGTSIPATSPPTSASWCKLTFDHEEPLAAIEAQDSQSSRSSPTGLGLMDGDEALRGLGLDDVVFDNEDELAPEDALDEQDERCNEGDDTLRPLDAPENEAPTEVKKKGSVLGHSRSSSVSSNVTSFDNGNVGVLGGGVKLGGSGASTVSRGRAHSNASNASSFSQSGQRSRQRSVESRTYGWAQQQQKQHQQSQHNALGLSNMVAVPQPAHQQQRHQPHPYTYASHAPSSEYITELQNHANALQARLDEAKSAFHQPERQSPPPLETVSLSKRKQGPLASTASVLGNASMNATKQWAVSVSSQDDTDTPKLGDGAWTAASKAYPASVDMDEEGDEGDENEPLASQEGIAGGKRVRTRGRRSRGRGAGRAARRAAAAAALNSSANGFSPAMMASPHFQMPGGQWSPSPTLLPHQQHQHQQQQPHAQSVFQTSPVVQHMGFQPPPPQQQARMPFAPHYSPNIQQHHHNFSPAMHPTRTFTGAQQGWHVNSNEAW